MSYRNQLLFFCSFLLVGVGFGVAARRPSSTHFIRQSCEPTLYPRLCYVSLAPHAPSIRHDPVTLAAVSANLTLTHLQHAFVHVASLRHSLASEAPVRRTVDRRTAEAVGDCVETLSTAADLAAKSMGEIEALRSAVGMEIAWHVGNAQTWMSAALTDEDTCTDGFESCEGTVVEDVTGRVEWTKRYTSNALALVNNLVAR